jgi:hypothetical protein
VPENVHLVFSEPPEWLAADDFDRWYEAHVREILAVDGYDAARRFELHAAVGTTSPTMYSRLALYGISGDPAETLAGLQRAVEAGAVAHPEWFGEARFASFVGRALEGPIDLATLDHTYLVFSRPPAQIGLEDYIDWYYAHMRENLTATGFDAAWRYRLEPDRVDPLAPCDAVHAAIYEVHGDMPTLRAALKEAADAGRVSFPEWFGEIQFASMDCYAISGAVAAVPA